MSAKVRREYGGLPFAHLMLRGVGLQGQLTPEDQILVPWHALGDSHVHSERIFDQFLDFCVSSSETKWFSPRFIWQTVRSSACQVQTCPVALTELRSEKERDQSEYNAIHCVKRCLSSVFQLCCCGS